MTAWDYICLIIGIAIFIFVLYIAFMIIFTVFGSVIGLTEDIIAKNPKVIERRKANEKEKIGWICSYC